MNVVRTFFTFYGGIVVATWLVVFEWVLRMTHDDCVRPMAAYLKTARRRSEDAVAEESV